MQPADMTSLLMPDTLDDVTPSKNDDICRAMAVFIDSSAVDFSIESAIELCDRTLQQLGLPITKPVQSTAAKGRSEQEAEAYDAYFPIVRVAGNARHIRAFNVVTAFREMLLESRQGCSLTPVEWGLIRTGFLELARQVATDDQPKY